MFPDFLPGSAGVSGQKLGCRQQHARRTETALGRITANKGILKISNFTTFGEALNGLNRASISLDRKR
tara:strand:+ start:115 stop:318 length:204 start_codon:yes stop_codon:yes gene_type:complete